MTNINDYPKTIETINNIINNNRIAEVKIERDKDIVVVEVSRTVRNSERKDG
jgi:inorganic pyrophosphatase